MTDKKIIAVVGATGRQGGAVVRAFLGHGDHDFVVRALTRDPSSAKAKALADLGVEVVWADANDEAAMATAFDGTYGAFLVTDMFADKETEHATTMAHAAAAAGLQHVIWSTLEDTRALVPLDDPRMPTLKGRYKVPHFDAKADADAVFAELAVPTTLLRVSAFWEDVFRDFVRRDIDGTLVFTVPMADAKLPGTVIEDIGLSVLGIFRDPQRFIGAAVAITNGNHTGVEVAAALSRHLGEEVRYAPDSIEDIRKWDTPFADEVANQFQYKVEFNDEFTAARDVDFVRSFSPGLHTLDSWLAGHIEVIKERLD